VRPLESSAFANRRPGFMLLMVVFAVAITAGIGFLAERMYDAREARAAEREEIDRRVREEMLELGWQPVSVVGENPSGLEFLAATRPFSLELGNGPVAAQVADESRRDIALAIVNEELGRYPRGFLEKSRFRRVLLCANLNEAAREIPSLPNFQQTLLLDVNATPDFLRRVVHHEVFHFADYADDDQVKSDPEWTKENGNYFVYGSGGRYLRNPAVSSPNGAPPGFVTRYATSALEEDKAETFAFLMVAPGMLAERTKSDPVLARKVARVKSQLAPLGYVVGG
jgi:hypothetical protein